MSYFAALARRGVLLFGQIHLDPRASFLVAPDQIRTSKRGTQFPKGTPKGWSHLISSLRTKRLQTELIFPPPRARFSFSNIVGSKIYEGGSGGRMVGSNNLLNEIFWIIFFRKHKFLNKDLEIYFQRSLQISFKWFWMVSCGYENENENLKIHRNQWFLVNELTIDGLFCVKTVWLWIISEHPWQHMFNSFKLLCSYIRNIFVILSQSKRPWREVRLNTWSIFKRNNHIPL